MILGTREAQRDCVRTEATNKLSELDIKVRAQLQYLLSLGTQFATNPDFVRAAAEYLAPMLEKKAKWSDGAADATVRDVADRVLVGGEERKSPADFLMKDFIKADIERRRQQYGINFAMLPDGRGASMLKDAQKTGDIQCFKAGSKLLEREIQAACKFGDESVKQLNYYQLVIKRANLRFDPATQAKQAKAEADLLEMYPDKVRQVKKEKPQVEKVMRVVMSEAEVVEEIEIAAPPIAVRNTEEIARGTFYEASPDLVCMHRHVKRWLANPLPVATVRGWRGYKGDRAEEDIQREMAKHCFPRVLKIFNSPELMKKYVFDSNSKSPFMFVAIGLGEDIRMGKLQLGLVRKGDRSMCIHMYFNAQDEFSDPEAFFTAVLPKMTKQQKKQIIRTLIGPAVDTSQEYVGAVGVSHREVDDSLLLRFPKHLHAPSFLRIFPMDKTFAN